MDITPKRLHNWVLIYIKQVCEILEFHYGWFHLWGHSFSTYAKFFEKVAFQKLRLRKGESSQLKRVS